MRLDKFLCDMKIGTRSQVKDYIRTGQVTVNGFLVKQPDTKVDEKQDKIVFCGTLCVYQQYAYYMLNKPAGVVSATYDPLSKTVIDLLTGVKETDLFPVGRLDKDTEGLLLICNDGELAHKLLSPKKHVDKVYLVGIRQPLKKEEIIQLEQGVDIGEEKVTLPAKVKRIEDKKILLTIQEGKFHQVKRMLQAVGNEVVSLKRISFGPIQLDEQLPAGSYRPLTAQELSLLPISK